MRFEQYLTICATAVLAWFASATGAAAQNLVQNSGFEEGSSRPANAVETGASQTSSFQSRHRPRGR